MPKPKTLRNLRTEGFSLISSRAYAVQRYKTNRTISLHELARAEGHRFYELVDADGNILLMREDNLTIV